MKNNLGEIEMNHSLIERLDRIEKKIDEKPAHRYFDIVQASAYTSLSISTLRRYVARGELKCSRKLGKLLFLESDIRKWLNG